MNQSGRLFYLFLSLSLHASLILSTLADCSHPHPHIVGKGDTGTLFTFIVNS